LAKIAGPLIVSYGDTQKTDQKFHEKMLVFHGVAGNFVKDKKDRNPEKDAVFL